jgi:hypothetical protein
MKVTKLRKRSQPAAPAGETSERHWQWMMCKMTGFAVMAYNGVGADRRDRLLASARADAGRSFQKTV